MRAPESEYDARRWYASTLKPIPRRRWLRWAMTLQLACVIAAPVLSLAKPDSHVLLALMLLVVGPSLSPFGREAFLVDKGFATFDEFEQQALLTSLRRAYSMSLILIATVFAWLTAGQGLGWPTPQLTHQWFTLGCSLLIVMATLPTLIAEWTIPLPDNEDASL